MKYANLNLQYKNRVYKISLPLNEEGKVNITEEDYNCFSESIKACIGSVIGEFQLYEFKDKEYDITNKVIVELKEKLFPNINEKISYYNSEALPDLMGGIKLVEFDYYRIECYYA